MTLRGGGASCSQINFMNVNLRHSDDDMIQNFLKDVGSKCEEIQAASSKIGLQESKDLIIEKIKWFDHASQFVNQLNRDGQMMNENIRLILDNLKILLSSIQNIIQSQKFLSLQLLNICNQFSRQIFIYYVNNPQYKMKQEEQASIQEQLKDIQQMAKQDQQNSYQNSIYYQQTLITMCIDTCPTDLQQGQEVLMSTFSGILSSLTEMTPTTDLLEALGNGALFLAKEYKKKQQLQIFQVIFYLEELKWQFIEELQNGIGINKILAIMSQNYKQLVLKSNLWIIKCSWIKIICELLIYKPLITKKRFYKLKNQYQLTDSWEEALQLQLINIIDTNKNIGIIQSKNISNRTGRILNIQLNKFEQFKLLIINGHQDIPKLQNLIINQSTELDHKNINNIIKFQQSLDYLPLIQISQQIQQFIQNLTDYSEAINEILEEKTQITTIIFDQIEQLIMQNQQLVNQSKDLQLHGQILILQLDILSQSSKQQIHNDQTTDKYLLFYMFQQYFEAIQNQQPNIINEQSQQFIEKIKDKVYKILSNNDLKVISQQQDVKQTILQINQQLQKQSLEINISPLQKLQLFIKLIKEFQQTFEQEIRKIFIDHKIILQNVKQTQNILLLQKLAQVTFNQQFYFIYQMNTYNNINTIINDLKFDENTMTELQQNKLSDLLLIDFQSYSYEVEDIIHQKNSIWDQLQNIDQIQDIQENLEFQSQTLKHIKQLFIKYEKWLQEFIKHIDNYINILKVSFQFNIQQQPKIIQQLKQNFEQLINLSNIKLNQQDLNQIINQRIEIFQTYQSQDQQLNKLIQNEINFYKFFIDDEYIQQVSEQIINKIQLNQNNIIEIIQSQQNQLVQDNLDSELQQYFQFFEQLITICKKLSFLMEQAQQGFQYSSLLVFKISQLVYSNNINQSINSEQYLQINQKYNESLELAREVVDQNINELKQVFSFNPNQLPVINIQDELIYQIFPSYKKLSDQNIIIQKTQQNSFDLVQKFRDFIEDDNWRIKEYFYFNCINVYSQIQNQQIKTIVGQLILYGKYKETDIRVISTLKNKELISQMQLLISNQWEETKNDIHTDLQKTLNQLQVLQLQLQGEERKLERDKILQQHKEIEQQLEQQMQNVNEISDVLGITIHFLKDIRKDLGLIQNKLDNIIDSIEQIGQDIKFLTGKSPQQLLEIRMEQVLQNQIVQDAQSVYVQMWTKEFKLEKRKDDDDEDKKDKDENEDKKTPLFNYDQINTGEIDEFLVQETKSSLLIHGPAGSGKSLTARKIEEYLWKQYQLKVNNQRWEKITEDFIIPIFIQLPALKEPKFNSIEETLKSSQYKFDQKQVDLFKDIVQGSEKIKLLFIMDSYDELAKEYQQINLIQTNKINQWKKQTQKMNPKVITTSRSEIFANLDYRLWFYGDDNQGLQGYKEIRILPFDDAQRNEFLNQFSFLQLKLQIKELMEIINKKKQQDIILQDTINIFYQIKPLIQGKSKSSYLVNNTQSIQILNIIKQHPNVIAINNDQELSFNKQIQTIWSTHQYNKSIQQMEISQILETPFMMNIVVEVLPQMNEKFSSQNYIKSQFQNSYVKNKQNQITSIIKMHQYDNQYIKQLYSNDEIKQLQQIYQSIDQIKNESYNVWEYLVNYNFFKQFSAQLNQKEILSIFTNIENQTKMQIPFSILKKERDVDNQLIIYKALTTRNSSLYDFYQVFLSNYIEKQRQKQIYNSQINDQEQFLIDIHQFAQRLAVTMTRQNDTIVEIKVQGVLFRQKVTNDPYQEFFQDQDKYATYRKLIIKCLPIKQKSNYFSFNHKSIQEYLFSKDIIDLLTQIHEYEDTIQFLRQQKNDQESNIYNPIKAKVKDFFKSSSLNYVHIGNMPSIIKFLKAGIQFNANLQDACYNLSLISSFLNEFTILSSNALLILANVLLCITDKDFSRINIEDINLDGMNFINCNFSESNFRRVSIIGINLNQSNLSKTNWIDCYSNDTYTLKCPENVYCECICFSKQENYVFSGCSDGIIRIWDKQIGKLYRQIDTHSKRVLYVSQNDNGNIITVTQSKSGEYEIQFWDFEAFKMLLKQKTIFRSFFTLISHSNDNIVFAVNDKCLQAQNFVLQKNLNIITLNHQIQNIQIKKDTNLCYILQVPLGQILIWDFVSNHITKTIQFTEKFQEIQSNIQCNQFTSDCQLYSYRYNSKFIIFNTESMQNIEIFYPEQKQINFYFSEDKKYIAFSEFYGFAIMDAQTQQFLTPPLFGHTSSITCIKFSNQSQDLITCGHDSFIKFWDLNMLQNKQNLSLQKLTEKRDQYAQYSQDGLKLFIMNTKLSVYDPYTGQPIESFNIVFDKFIVRPNGKQIIYHKQYQTYCYDLNLKQEFEIPFNTQSLITQSNDGQLLFYQKVDYPESISYIVQIDESNYSIKNQSQEIEAEFGYFSYDNKSLYYLNEKQIIEIKINLDGQSDQIFQKGDILYQHNREIINFLISKDKRQLIFLDIDDKIYIYDIMQKISNLIGNFESGKIDIQFQLLNNDKHLIIFDEYYIVVIDTSNYQQVGIRLKGHKTGVQQLLASPSGIQFTTIGDDDNAIKIWDLNEQDLNNNLKKVYIERLIIPQQLNQSALVNNCNYEECKIYSHLGYNLNSIWNDQ